MDTPDFDESTNGELDDLLRRVASAPPRTPPALPVAGERWGRRRRYRIEHCVGKGGMGAVYLAYDLLLDRPVALKVLHRSSELGDAASRGRLLHEARAAARIEHDRVARVYDVGEHEGVPFVAMEYIRGVTLRRWMQQHVAETPEIVAIGLQIAEALDALHRNGIVHRDLKPENVMLSETGGIKLLDLGLAKRTVTRDEQERAADRASASLRVGTPGYMAPEQYGGDPVDARADVFALGVVLYELVAREPPFAGASPLDRARATVSEAPAFDDERWRVVPAILRAVVERALAKDPSRRPTSARDVVEALGTLMPPSSARPPSSALVATIDLERAPTVAVPSHAALARTPSSSWKGVAQGRAWIVAAACTLPLVVFDAAPDRAVPDPSWAPRGMVALRGGTIRLGRTRAELDAECAHLTAPCPTDLLAIETPPAAARVAPFAIDAREVTVGDFATFLRSIGAQLRVDPDEDDGARRYVRFASGVHAGELVADLWHGLAGITYEAGDYRVRAGAESLPMRLVSWFGANVYCHYRVARLPTEAEWELAAHGDTARRFPWGDDPPVCGGVTLPSDGMVPVVVRGPCVANPEGPIAVGASPQDVTPEGVHDLGGNVGEWTDTKIAKLAVAAAAAPSGTTGPAPSANDVDDAITVRGGSYHEAFLARTTARTRVLRGAVEADLGFRCAVSAPAK